MKQTNQRGFALMSCVAATLTACVYSTDDPQAAAVASNELHQVIACQRTQYFQDGRIEKFEERYDLARINRRLEADANFQAFVGLEQASTCDDARSFARRRDAFEDQLPSVDETVTDTAATDAAESGAEIVDKIFNGTAS